jgi:hypothetical protein
MKLRVEHFHVLHHAVHAGNVNRVLRLVAEVARRSFELGIAYAANGLEALAHVLPLAQWCTVVCPHGSECP